MKALEKKSVRNAARPMSYEELVRHVMQKPPPKAEPRQRKPTNLAQRAAP
jgi:hypothetical protein